MVGHLIKYNIHLQKMMKWCHPHKYPTEVKLWPARKNLLHFLPCGLVNKVVKQNEKIVIWEIKVNSNFYVNVTFLRFEIRDNSKDCSSSALKIAAYKNGGWRSRWYWTYCGHRPLWSEIIGSNNVGMAINQNDINFRFNVSFTYCIIDRSEYVEVDLQYIQVGPIFHQQLNYQIKHEFCLKWIINLTIGYVVHFSNIHLRNLIGLFYIYDGPKYNYTIFSLHQTLRDNFVDKVNTTSKYYISVIKFLPQNHKKQIVGIKVVELDFTKQRLVSNTKVHLNRRVRIQHNGHILQSVYPISLDTNFTNVTFNIRKFHGWNEGRCNMGGYAIIQELSKDNSVLIRSGPYCPGGGSNQPLITGDGPKYIVLSNWNTYLVIYAFGPEYWIDIDLITSTSLCEGFFDFPIICETIIKISHNKNLTILVNWAHFQLTCGRYSRQDITFISVRMPKLRGCVIAQSILYRQQIPYELELFRRMHINIKLHAPLLHGVLDTSTSLGEFALSWRDPNTGYPHSKYFTGHKDLQIGEVSTLIYMQYTRATFHGISMVMIIKTLTFGDRDNKCERIVGSTAKQTRQLAYKNDIKLASLCASGYYRKATSYFYAIVPTYKTYHNDLSNVYFNIQNTNCGKFTNMSSAVTIIMRRSFTQSLQLTSNATIQIEVPNVSVFLAFDKHESCSMFIFQYRVYFTVFHNSTLASIMKTKDFQVFNLFNFL